jgi:AcrR family transcriptional regulator
MQASTPIETSNKTRSAKGARTRARLIESSKKVFEEDGFRNARITDICEAAGLSHGSFYHYFESKEEIFRELAEAQEVSLLSMHDDESSPGGEVSTIERIREANRRYLVSYRAEAKLMKVIEEVSRYDTEVLRVRVARQHEFAERLQGSIGRLQRERRADPAIDPRYAADALGGMVAKFAEMWVSQGESYDLGVAVDQLTRLWANALGMQTESQPGAHP